MEMGIFNWLNNFIVFSILNKQINKIIIINALFIYLFISI